MQDQSKVAVSKLIENLFIFSTSNFSEFALFSQISNVTKSDIELIHCHLGHFNINSMIKMIPIFIGIEISNNVSKFLYEIYEFAK